MSIMEFADTGQNLAPYVYNISSKQFAEIRFVPVGLWDEKKILKFYDPQRELSLILPFIYRIKSFIEAPVDRLGNLMKSWITSI
ncbi:hypothetical protein CS542_10030 [Pedobacter sp. IW39]|nr:hypothetical protein CS542_10030 [Pedobacter sp. IW39]